MNETPPGCAGGEGQLKKRNQTRAGVFRAWNGLSKPLPVRRSKGKPLGERPNFKLTAQRSAPAVFAHQPTSNVSTRSTAVSVIPMLQLVNGR